MGGTDTVNPEPYPETNSYNSDNTGHYPDIRIVLLVINGLMIWMTSSLIPGFFVPTFLKAIFFSLLLSAATYLIESILSPYRRY
jgi:hypothetical protein